MGLVLVVPSETACWSTEPNTCVAVIDRRMVTPSFAWFTDRSNIELVLCDLSGFSAYAAHNTKGLSIEVLA